MRIRILPALLLLSLAPAACLDSDGKGAEDDPFDDIDVAKDDSFQRPTEHGALAYDVPGTASLSSRAKFHAWEFDVLLPGQTPTAIALGPQTGGGAEVDTVVYLYKRQANGRWGSYIAKNDDANGSLWSYLSRALDAGHYRVIVKGYSERTYGKFGVTLSCDRYACSQPVNACVFGSTFSELDRQRFAFGSQTTLTSATGLDATARAQIVRALHASSHTDVTTAEQAFMRADSGEINRIELRDWFAVRSYITWEYGAGDNSYGAIFDERDLEPAAEIHDGDIYECNVPAATCIFGQHYDLEAQPDLAILRQTTFNPGTDTTAIIRSQILAAAQLYVPELTTVGAVFDRVTDNEVRRVDVVHTPTRREFSFYTYILGDHRFGAAFWKDTTSFAVEVEDNVFERCDAF
ncbi:MAG TPA: hypothetical protein VM261_31580 [Kofleriaceae bacterium]|nr:hypothetical protein [Kofleriaceae bacterium]